jgi:hypothetical protein
MSNIRFVLHHTDSYSKYMLCSEGGQMCAIKEVKVISDDSNSKECLRQLNQVIIYYENIVNIGINFEEETVFPSRTDTS